MPAIPPSLVSVLMTATRDHETNPERLLITRRPSRRAHTRIRRYVVLRRQPSDRATVSTHRLTDRHAPLRGRRLPTSVALALVAVLAASVAVLVLISRGDAVDNTAAHLALTRPEGPASSLVAYEVKHRAGSASTFGSTRV